MSETTRKILDFYRKIGNCDTLKYWRDTVPVDARKAWLRSFVTTVAIDKMLDERYNHIFNKHISEEIQKAFNIKNKEIDDIEDRMEKLENSSEDEDIDNEIEALENKRLELVSDLHYFVRTQITDTMLEDFAKLYFTSFEENSDEQKKLEKQVEDSTEILTDVVKKTLPMIDTIVLTGSSAIGKRPQDYPKQQDFDFFLLPKKTSNPEQLETLKRFLRLVSSMVNDTDTNELFTHDEINSFSDLIASWQPVINFFKNNNLLVDLHIATVPNDQNRVDDWRKLTGPHKVLAQLSERSDQTYQTFLKFSIDTARVEAKYLI